MKKCIFCDYENPSKIVLENDLAYAIFDNNPVSKGHMIFMTKSHQEDFFSVTKEERSALFALLDEAKIMIDQRHSPDGYNIGMNCGEFAGQTVMHIHIHLIPRYKGDVLNPRGGVRGVIPDKRDY